MTRRLWEARLDRFGAALEKNQKLASPNPRSAMMNDLVGHVWVSTKVERHANNRPVNFVEVVLDRAIDRHVDGVR